MKEYNKKGNLYKVVAVRGYDEFEIEEFTNKEDAVLCATLNWGWLSQKDKQIEIIEIRQCNKKDYSEDIDDFMNYNTVEVFKI